MGERERLQRRYCLHQTAPFFPSLAAQLVFFVLFCFVFLLWLVSRRYSRAKAGTRFNQKTVGEGSKGEVSLLLAPSPIVFSLDLARPCKYEPEMQIGTRSNQKTVGEGSKGEVSLLLAPSPIVFSLDLARPCKYEPEMQIAPKNPPATFSSFTRGRILPSLSSSNPFHAC